MAIGNLFDLLKERGKRKGVGSKKENKKEVKFEENKKICIDGTALLSLTKAGVIEDAVNFYNIILTPSLKDEIEREKKENEPEAHTILKLIDAGRISVKNVFVNKDLMLYGLYGVELEIVSYFLNNNCTILSDDAIIRENKEILKLKVVSTPAFILNLFNKKFIGKEKAIDAFITLRKERWFNDWIIDECIRRVKLE